MKNFGEKAAPVAGRSLGADAWRRLCANRMAMGGLAFTVLVTLACIVGPWLLPHAPETQDLALGASGPSATHWLGTDTLGRDLLARILSGGRVSLMVGAVATTVALVIGVSYGIVSGYAGGRTDRLMMRFVEIIYSMPFTVFVIILMVVFGRHLWLIFVAIGAVEWLTMARIVRGQVLALREQAFVQASRSLGQGPLKIMTRHLLPNLLGVIIVYATLTVPGVMLLEAFISFLGLGVQPPDTSWGDLIRAGAESMEEYPWLLIYPSLFFSATLFSLNFLGDGLRDALDPRA
ncbi:ABC transporter permease [Ruficoccus sp. ZRK36]|uniref:ABC transporter permease n=1 Tax=Ruficoccus sp. ZRK36 TaxID=2866311 RepID=UPI0031F2FBD0